MKADLPNHEKENIIIKEFQKLGYDMNARITKVQLEQIIDGKTGHKFDAEVFDDLYKNMRKEFNGDTTLNDFVSVWLEADSRLKSKINYCDSLVQDYTGQREEAVILFSYKLGYETS